MPWVGDPHAGIPTGAYGGAPYEATKRCPGWGTRMRTPRVGPTVELLICLLYTSPSPRDRSLS
eukprot:5674190-Pyramimonas_sp.AAC.1